MKRLWELAKQCADYLFKLAFAPALCTLIVLLWLTPLRNQARQTVQSFGKVAMKANDSFVDQQRFWSTALPKTLGKVNDDLDATHDTIVQGKTTLQDGSDVLIALRGTSEVATSTMQQFGEQLSVTNDQAQDFIKTATATAAAAKPTLEEATKTEHDLDTLVMDPDWALTLSNVQRGTNDGAALIQDGRIEADKFAHPDKKKLGFWGATAAVGNWLQHFMPPIF